MVQQSYTTQYRPCRCERLRPGPFFLCPISHTFSLLQGFYPRPSQTNTYRYGTACSGVAGEFKIVIDLGCPNSRHQLPLQTQEGGTKVLFQTKSSMIPQTQCKLSVSQPSDILCFLPSTFYCFVLWLFLSHPPHSTTSSEDPWRPLESIKAKLLLTLDAASQSSVTLPGTHCWGARTGIRSNRFVAILSPDREGGPASYCPWFLPLELD